MLLLYLTVSLFCVCSPSKADMCYGTNFNFYLKDFSGSLFFTPTNGGVRRLLVQDGKSVDPRLKPNANGGLVLSDLTEQDNGTFSAISTSGGQPTHMSTLVVVECADPETKRYGDVFSLRILRSAEFLEFTPSKKLEQVKVIWNRTDPNGGRGSVTRSHWEITGVTQEDSGYYKFRGKNYRLVSWKKLSVNEKEKKYFLEEGESLLLEHPEAMSTVTFEPEKTMGYHTPVKQLTEHNTGAFKHRMIFSDYDIVIDPVKAEDTGILKFKDANGNVILRVELEVVRYESPVWMYALFMIGVIFAVVFCWCCIKKCCKRSSPKRDNPAPQPAAAAGVTLLSYQQEEPQPVHPRHSTSPAPVYSHLPLNPPVYRDPASTSAAPPVDASRGQGAAPLLSNTSDFISSNSDPQFELKGFFSSASPLSSDTGITDVYSSDKLNFL